MLAPRSRSLCHAVTLAVTLTLTLTLTPGTQTPEMRGFMSLGFLLASVLMGLAFLW